MHNIGTRVFCGAALGSGIAELTARFTDTITGKDPFSEHSRQQHMKHWISGMHEPYIPNPSQQEIIKKHFSEFEHLIPLSQDAIDKQCTLKSPVHLKRLSDCPADLSKIPSTNTVVVGGPPALISTAEENVTYINDNRRSPIAFGSAFHLEWDAESEAPTSAQPLHFMKDQVKRLAFPEFLATAEQTGHFSWKSLDWASWIQTPSKWATGARVAIAFQRFTQSGPHPEVSTEVANRTKKNEDFYSKLDEELDHQLLLPGEGSVYIARTSNEKTSLMNMQQGLTKEKRAFPMLSESEIVKEFGYRPQGEAFAKKVHDRVLSPNFISLLSNRITRNGGNVLNACVTSIYANNPEDGGVVEYQVEGDEKKHYIQFKKLVMSLGTQQVLGVDNAPIFDIVSARGVSAIALIHLPKGATLPAVVVCGETNHVTKLAGPLDINGENVVLARMTCGACITPTSDSANYDGAAALGLRKAVSKTLNAQVEILSTYGCNRQVSQYGQTHWLEVNKQLKTNSHGLTPRGDAEDVGTSLPNKLTGIFIQYGAGGGGLTQAPSQPSS